MTKQKNEIILKAPRSFIIFFIQYLAIIPFCTALGFLILALSSAQSHDSYDNAILLSLISFFLVIGFALLYFPQRERTICIYDENKNILKKVKKNRDILICDLNVVSKVILKIIKKDVGVNIEILLKKTNRNIELYCEQNYLSYKQWIVFADQLAKVTSLPLVEDFVLWKVK